MAHLKNVLDGLQNFSALPLPQAPSRLESQKQNIVHILGETIPREPSSYDLMETYQVLVDMPVSAEAVAALPTKHLKRAPWVLFEAPREGLPCLADNDQLLSAYVEGLKQRLFSPAIVILAMLFLRYYPASKPYFDFLRKQIDLLVAKLTSIKGRTLAQRAERFCFFQKDGSTHFGTLLAGASDPGQIVAEAGFDLDTYQIGFVSASVEKMLGQMAADLRSRKASANGLANSLLFLSTRNDNSKKLRFPLLRVKIANSLLLPFESVPPDPHIQEIIKRFMLEHFNDPRISAGSWHAVREEARKVMMRWLVHGTLLDFFRVVRKGSHQDKDADRMWPYREAFWSAYLRKGVITDAWVVLGEIIAVSARSFLKDQVDNYGVLERGNGVKPVHAALIMRIGDLVITEWNHMGKYRVWHDGNEDAPKFYKTKRPYTRWELIKNPDFDGSHHGAQNGTWQNSLSSLIKEWTGVRVTYSEYMPKW